MVDYNYINHDSQISINNNCIYDSNVGYESDFSVNGEVDGWEVYDGIHTFGCWSGFLFGTLYTNFAMIARNDAIHPIDGEVYYKVVITMLIGPTNRANSSQELPTKAKFMWITASDDTWDDKKSYIFDIYPD